MNRFAAILLVGSPCIATATVKVEASVLVPSDQYATMDPSEVAHSGQDFCHPFPHVWMMANEDAPIPLYDYRDRSRAVDRGRKQGRLRDERGENSQRSSTRGGTWRQINSEPSNQGESADDDEHEGSFGENEEGL